MSVANVIARSHSPQTVSMLIERLRACGLEEGQRVLVHSSMSSIGWIAGGAVAVIQALLEVIGTTGTLMMPAHTADNSDPAQWSNPPVPAAWWSILRDHLPAYDPAITPTCGMGTIAESFRRWPGVERSAHPVGSFCAYGPMASQLLGKHTNLEAMFGEGSPLARLYELDGHVLLLGVGHENNTSLHLAEHRARIPSKPTVAEGTTMLVDGVRRWVSFDMLKLETEDFNAIGADFEKAHGVVPGRVGEADVRLLRQRILVDFATDWMERNRSGGALNDSR